MSKWSGGQNALIRTTAGPQLASLGLDAARTATSNTLAKEGFGIDWGKLALAEKEAGAGRTWQTGESALDRALAKEMAEKGYAFYGKQNKTNQQNALWNSLIGAGGYAAGSYLGSL